MTKTSNDNLTFPLPPSPKSVFRLAHFLQLEELKALALESIRTQLTVENAVVELVSDVSRCYEDAQRVVIDFVVEHWEKVKASKGMVELERKIQADEVPEMAAVAGILLKLAKRVKNL